VNHSCWSCLLLGFIFGVTITIGSAYGWYEWFGGREYIKDRITQEASTVVAKKIANINPVSKLNPFSWFGK
jgi:hypothetical protein